MKTTIDNTYYANIYMVGDIDHCKQFLSKYVKKGACVTVTPTEYIYTGGRETGFIVGLINYPKFPRSDEGIINETLSIANELIAELGQDSATIVTPEETMWLTLR